MTIFEIRFRSPSGLTLVNARVPITKRPLKLRRIPRMGRDKSIACAIWLEPPEVQAMPDCTNFAPAGRYISPRDFRTEPVALDAADICLPSKVEICTTKTSW